MSIELLVMLGALSFGRGDAVAAVDTCAYCASTGGIVSLDSSVMSIPSLDLFDDFDEKPADVVDPDEWFGMDKFWHFSVSCVLTGASYHLVHDRFGGTDPAAAVIALSGSFALGVIKEFYDLWRYGLFSFKDLTFDTAGIVAGYFIFIHEY
jgi:uncharacterized protein YfiM (DUF2279 family)